MQEAPDLSAAPSHKLATALLFITPALWSVNYLVARWAPGEIAPHMLAFCRWGLASLMLACFSWREIQSKGSAWKAEWWQFPVLGALGMWVCGAWVYEGARSTTAINIGLIYATSPVMIAGLSWLWLKEQLHGLQALGIGLALCGVSWVILRGDWRNVSAMHANPGDLWIACCAVAWAAYALLLKRWPTTYSPLARLNLTALGGCAVLALPTAIEFYVGVPSRLSYTSVGLVVASAALPGACAYFAYAYMQRHLGASRVAATLYLGPLYAAFFGTLLLGEHLAGFHAIGAALILPGIYLASQAPKKPVATAS